MDEENILKFVTEYLKKKGFKEDLHHNKTTHNSSSPISSTTQFDAEIAKHLLSSSESENAPARYQDGYLKLRSWTYNGTLDSHRHELLRVLYQVFVHSFMDLVASGHIQEARAFFNGFRKDHEKTHLRDLQKLEGVLSPSHLEEMEFAHSLKQSRVNVNIGQYPHDLLMQFLHESQSATVLNIINEHINFQFETMASGVKPEVPLPANPVEVEQSILDDLRNRVKLSSVALPSVRFYTFTNAHKGLNCSTISTDGSLVAAGFSDSSLRVWDMANESGSDEGKRPFTLFQGHSGAVYSACFSPMGDFLLSSSSDSTIRLWSTELNANVVCYKGHNYPTWDVQYSPVGHYFASASHDRTARVWSVERLQPLRILAGHLSDVDCVQWHENCNYIATGSSDKTVRLWDVQSGECVRIFIGHRSMVLSLAMSSDGRYMASGDEDGAVMLWDLSSGRCVAPLMGHTSCVWTVAFGGGGSVLASGSADCTVKVWDVRTSTSNVSKTEENRSGNTSRFRLLRSLATKSTPVNSLRFSERNLLFGTGVLPKAV